MRVKQTHRIGSSNVQDKDVFPTVNRTKKVQSKFSKNGRRKRNRFKWLGEVRKYQKGIDPLMNKTPFRTTVKHIIKANELGKRNGRYKFSREAIDTLQEAVEYFAIELLQDAQLAYDVSTFFQFVQTLLTSRHILNFYTQSYPCKENNYLSKGFASCVKSTKGF